MIGTSGASPLQLPSRTTFPNRTGDFTKQQQLQLVAAVVVLSSLLLSDATRRTASYDAS